MDSFENVCTCVAMFQQQSHLIGEVSKAVRPYIGANMVWVQQLCNLADGSSAVSKTSSKPSRAASASFLYEDSPTSSPGDDTKPPGDADRADVPVLTAALPAAGEHKPRSNKGAPTTRARPPPSVEEVLAELSGVVLFTLHDYMLPGVIGEDYDIEPVSIAEPAVKPIQLYL